MLCEEAEGDFQYQKGAIKTAFERRLHGLQPPFNTKKVRLKHHSSACFQARMSSFNTKKVRLKLKSRAAAGGDGTPFNTKKVRLKLVSSADAYAELCFQYQKGAIKTWIVIVVDHGYAAFNTKKVRLKRGLEAKYLKLDVAFNTKKVRLKPQAFQNGTVAVVPFNTKKVRLKP